MMYSVIQTDDKRRDKESHMLAMPPNLSLIFGCNIIRSFSVVKSRSTGKRLSDLVPLTADSEQVKNEPDVEELSW